ncbi:S1 RNA-binding domain-containing protein [Kitasatospora griseola]|uniref:S1 RNA-binding domain-containing protein n=1 Tax=Kitasatospora griseola TaxID=2064 RepID=UPI0019BCFA02|nr:S1 RNA-binding domain-containing protein [Kitasatospora griseola]GGQ82125.1 hypothetical protein GCM10010195_42160 [Kitasatospora griseola]
MKLEREPGRPVDPNLVFFLMPYGRKAVPDGRTLDFDSVYRELESVVRSLGLSAQRADTNDETTLGPLEAAWDGVDRAGIVVVDLSVPSTSVAMELGWAMCLHKRMVVTMYEGAAVPTNVVGRLRPITYTQEFEQFGRFKNELRERIQAELQRTAPERDLVPRTATWGAYEATAQVELAFPDRVFVRNIQDPLQAAEMRREEVSYWDMVPEDMSASKHYRQGSTVNGFFVVDQGRVVFTQRYRQENPWPRLVAAYRLRQVYSARVTNVSPAAGAFIELLPEGGKSFIPAYQVRAAGIAKDDEVQVRILRVDPVQRRIDVALADAPKAGLATPPAGEYPTVGERFAGTVHDVQANKGYVRVRLDGYRRPGLLHRSNMSDALWQAVRAGRVTAGSTIDVVVLRVTASRNRVAQWDIALEEDRSAQAAPRQTAAGADDGAGTTVPGQGPGA